MSPRRRNQAKPNAQSNLGVTGRVPDDQEKFLTWPLANLTPGKAWMWTVVVTVPLGYGGTLTNRVRVTTAGGATGEAQIAVNAIGYRIYLPVVLRN